MYSFSEDAVITGAISTAWTVASDVAGRPSWDLHEQKRGGEAAWLSRGAKASQATRSAEMSQPAIPSRAAR